MSVRRQRAQRRMVYWSRIDAEMRQASAEEARAATPPVAISVGERVQSRLEMYGARKAMRMGLAELGVPATIAYPIAAAIVPALQVMVQWMITESVRVEVQKQFELFIRHQEQNLRQVYKGLVPEA